MTAPARAKTAKTAERSEQAARADAVAKRREARLAEREVNGSGAGTRRRDTADSTTRRRAPRAATTGKTTGKTSEKTSEKTAGKPTGTAVGTRRAEREAAVARIAERTAERAAGGARRRRSSDEATKTRVAERRATRTAKAPVKAATRTATTSPATSPTKSPTKAPVKAPGRASARTATPSPAKSPVKSSAKTSVRASVEAPVRTRPAPERVAPRPARSTEPRRATSAAAQRAFARRAHREGYQPQSLSGDERGSGRAAFVVLIISLLTVGVAATLWLSTQAIADSYRLEETKTGASQLAEEAEQLQRDVTRAESPSELAKRAKAMGMVPGGDPARLVVLPNGEVVLVGEPTPAAKPTPPPSDRQDSGTSPGDG
jgi:hypothetical protein